MALKTDLKFLDLAAKAGIRNFYCTMNVDPISIKALQGGKKEQQMLCDLVKNLEDRGIRFFGSYAIGRDWDDTSIADRIIELSEKAKIRTSEFFLLRLIQEQFIGNDLIVKEGFLIKIGVITMELMSLLIIQP